MDKQLQRLDREWYELFLQCNVYPWYLGVLQPDYVHMPQQLIIIDDCKFENKLKSVRVPKVR